jgi:hypothetical protein
MPALDALTSRAEHAVLGAMVANPALCDRLRRCVKPAEFEDEWHRHVYETILSVSHGRPPVLDGWREAVLQADPSLTPDDLNVLARGCPDPGHGIVYGTMVVACWARRHLADSGRAMAARSRQLFREASLVSRVDAAGGREAAVIADHVGKVASAIRAHAAAIRPQATGAVLPGRADPSPGQARREDLVLAALVRQWPKQAREILQILRPEAFKPGRLRGLRETPRQAREAGEMPRPVLRLIQEPGPDRGPQAR